MKSCQKAEKVMPLSFEGIEVENGTFVWALFNEGKGPKFFPAFYCAESTVETAEVVEVMCDEEVGGILLTLCACATRCSRRALNSIT